MLSEEGGMWGAEAELNDCRILPVALIYASMRSVHSLLVETSERTR